MTLSQVLPPSCLDTSASKRNTSDAPEAAVLLKTSSCDTTESTIHSTSSIAPPDSSPTASISTPNLDHNPVASTSSPSATREQSDSISAPDTTTPTTNSNAETPNMSPPAKQEKKKTSMGIPDSIAQPTSARADEGIPPFDLRCKDECCPRHPKEQGFRTHPEPFSEIYKHLTSCLISWNHISAYSHNPPEILPYLQCIDWDRVRLQSFLSLTGLNIPIAEYLSTIELQSYSFGSRHDADNKRPLTCYAYDVAWELSETLPLRRIAILLRSLAHALGRVRRYLLFCEKDGFHRFSELFFARLKGSWREEFQVGGLRIRGADGPGTPVGSRLSNWALSFYTDKIQSAAMLVTSAMDEIQSLVSVMPRQELAIRSMIWANAYPALGNIIAKVLSPNPLANSVMSEQLVISGMFGLEYRHDLPVTTSADGMYCQDDFDIEGAMAQELIEPCYRDSNLIRSVCHDEEGLVVIEYRDHLSGDTVDLSSRIKTNSMLYSMLNDIYGIEGVYTLECLGTIYDKKSDRFACFYRYPGDVPVLASPPALKTLRWHLMNTETQPSVHTRCDIAFRVASTIFSLLICDFTHRLLCPESIIAFMKEDGNPDTLEAYVSGLYYNDDSRDLVLGHQATNHFSTAGLSEVLFYQPPESFQSEGDATAPKFRREWNIYALGVILMEIGLWASLTAPQKSNDISEPNRAIPSKQPTKLDASTFRQILLHVHIPLVAAQMGGEYAEVVRECLTVPCGEPKGFLANESLARQRLGERMQAEVIGPLRKLVQGQELGDFERLAFSDEAMFRWERNLQ